MSGLRVCANYILNIPIPQAYIKKGRTPIQVFPVPNAYTTFKQTAAVAVSHGYDTCFSGKACDGYQHFLDVLSQNVVYALGTGSTFLM